jgi:hypothetical protein
LPVPWIVSIDLLVTVPATVNAARLVGISCKPEKILASGSPTDRELERLELDRRYCLHAEVPHRVAHPERLPRELVRQLHWLAPIESHAAIGGLTTSAQYRTYVDRLRETGYDRPAWIASREAGKHVGWHESLEQRAMKVAMWYQHVDVDVSRPVVTTQPFRPGGVCGIAPGSNGWVRLDAHRKFRDQARTRGESDSLAAPRPPDQPRGWGRVRDRPSWRSE